MAPAGQRVEKVSWGDKKGNREELLQQVTVQTPEQTPRDRSASGSVSHLMLEQANPSATMKRCVWG